MGAEDLDRRQALCWAARGAGQAWQASGVKPSLGSCLLPDFLGGFAASVRCGLFPFASGFFSPQVLTVLDVRCSGGQRERENQRDSLLFWEASSQGLILKNFVQKERDPENPEQKKIGHIRPEHKRGAGGGNL